MNLLSFPPRALSGHGQARNPRVILRFPLTFRHQIPLLGPFLLSVVDSSCWQQQLSGKILRIIVCQADKPEELNNEQYLSGLCLGDFWKLIDGWYSG